MPVINGNPENIEGITLEEYLNRSGYNKNSVVIERNLEIVPKNQWAIVKIEANDNIEILNFVGGG